MKLAILLIRLSVAIVLLWGAWLKFSLPPEGPTIYQHWTAAFPSFRYLVPCLELALGVWLAAGIRPRASALLVVLLVSAFSGILMLEMAKPHPLPCGCMGIFSPLYEPESVRKELLLGIVRNVLILGGACSVYIAAGSAAKNAAFKVQQATIPQSIVIAPAGNEQTPSA